MTRCSVISTLLGNLKATTSRKAEICPRTPLAISPAKCNNMAAGGQPATPSLHFCLVLPWRRQPIVKQCWAAHALLQHLLPDILQPDDEVPLQEIHRTPQTLPGTIEIVVSAVP